MTTVSRITRFIEIDIHDLFKQAGIAPCRCKVAHSKVANDWCLFIEDKDGLQLVVIKPPAFQPGETSVRIAKNYWVFST